MIIIFNSFIVVIYNGFILDIFTHSHEYFYFIYVALLALPFILISFLYFYVHFKKDLDSASEEPCSIYSSEFGLICLRWQPPIPSVFL